jgi:drug/metabolite transporter (DMT)-like permease
MTALLNSTIPLWVSIITLMLFKQHLTKNMIFGLVAGFSGFIILVNPFTDNNQLSLIGTVSLTLSSIFWATGSLYSTKYKYPENIFASGGMLMICWWYYAKYYKHCYLEHFIISIYLKFPWILPLLTCI